MGNQRMESVSKKFIGCLICLSTALGVYAGMMLSPLLPDIAKTFCVDVVYAGNASSVTILFMGIFMFLGVPLIERLGNVNTMIVSLVTMCVGHVISALSINFLVLLIGRAVVGIGYGTIAACYSSMLTVGFSEKERTVLITCNTVLSSVIAFMGYSLILPLYQMFGRSWQKLVFLIALMNVFIMAIWFYVKRKNMLAENQKANMTIKKKKQNNGIYQAVRRKDIWMLASFVGISTFASNAVNIYLPSYLQFERGLPAEKASVFTGMISLAGIIGTVMGGIAIANLKKRKIVIWPAALMTPVALGIGVISTEQSWIVAGIILYGFLIAYRTPAVQAILTELEDICPAVIAAGYAMMFGSGNLLSFLAPTLLGVLENKLDWKAGMFCFVILLMIAAVFGIKVPETQKEKNN